VACTGAPGGERWHPPCALQRPPQREDNFILMQPLLHPRGMQCAAPPGELPYTSQEDHRRQVDGEEHVSQEVWECGTTSSALLALLAWLVHSTVLSWLGEG